MGNRAVIVSDTTTKENAKEKIGIYLHWYGGEESIKEFLDKAKEAGIRSVNGDTNYFWARFCQTVCNIISDGKIEETGVGIGIVSTLDCNNYDNGVYYINDNFEIVKHTDGKELEE